MCVEGILLQSLICMTVNCVLLWVLNGELVAGLLGLEPSCLPPSRSLQCVRTWSAIDMILVDVIFSN